MRQLTNIGGGASMYTDLDKREIRIIIYGKERRGEQRIERALYLLRHYITAYLLR